MMLIRDDDHRNNTHTIKLSWLQVLSEEITRAICTESPVVESPQFEVRPPASNSESAWHLIVTPPCRFKEDNNGVKAEPICVRVGISKIMELLPEIDVVTWQTDSYNDHYGASLTIRGRFLSYPVMITVTSRPRDPNASVLIS